MVALCSSGAVELRDLGLKFRGLPDADMFRERGLEESGDGGPVASTSTSGTWVVELIFFFRVPTSS